MSLRFRVNARSTLGRRLLSLPDDQRKAFFHALIARSLELVEKSRNPADFHSVVKALERIESSLARIETTMAANGLPDNDVRRSHQGMPRSSPEGLADDDIRRLVGTLDTLAH